MLLHDVLFHNGSQYEEEEERALSSQLVYVAVC